MRILSLFICFLNLISFKYFRGVIQRMIFNQDQTRVRRMETDAMNKLVKICKGIVNSYFLSIINSLSFSFLGNQVFPHQGGFIYPGTKWCGPGNIAKSEDDLGSFEAEDRCCRDHDRCPQALASGECKLGICNDSPFTRYTDT